MYITDGRIDGGKAFDWGNASQDYAKYRDIYPQEFYDKIIRRGLCVKDQHILDVGTGTGVLPRNMYRYGAKWVGADISERQIAQAKILSKGMDIDYCVSAAENIRFEENEFDVITACQCFWYFNHERCMPAFFRMLKPDGRILVLYMAWLPFEDKIAGASEKLVLKYNPAWSGAGETMHPIPIPACYTEKFELVYHEEYPLQVHFTRRKLERQTESVPEASAHPSQMKKFPCGSGNMCNSSAKPRRKNSMYCLCRNCRIEAKKCEHRHAEIRIRKNEPNE